jgi:hypothetical protein
MRGKGILLNVMVTKSELSEGAFNQLFSCRLV